MISPPGPIIGTSHNSQGFGDFIIGDSAGPVQPPLDFYYLTLEKSGGTYSAETIKNSFTFRAGK
jgi:hypothetical protein